MKQRADSTAVKPVADPRRKFGEQYLTIARMARKTGTTETAEAALEWEKWVQERLNTIPEKKAA